MRMLWFINSWLLFSLLFHQFPFIFQWFPLSFSIVAFDSPFVFHLSPTVFNGFLSFFIVAQIVSFHYSIVFCFVLLLSFNYFPTVSRYLWDGVLCCFKYPPIHVLFVFLRFYIYLDFSPFVFQ